MRLGCDPRSLIIDYALPASKREEKAFALATVIPIKTEASETGNTHRQWTMEKGADAWSNSQSEDVAEGETYEILGKGDLLGPMCNDQKGDRLFWSNAPAEFLQQKTVTSSVDGIFGDFAEMALFSGNVQRGKPRVITGVPFEFVFGDATTAAIYRILEEERPAPQVFTVEDISNAFAQDLKDISQSGLIRYLGEVPTDSPKSTLKQHILSPKVLCTIVNLYQHLKDATIAMTLTSSKLYNVKWMPNTGLKAMAMAATYDKVSVSNQALEEASRTQVAYIQAFEPIELDLASSFACIVMLEFGNIDLASTGLHSVMAMSSGDPLHRNATVV